MERSFKGIWIPAEIWLNKDLKVMEKLFLVEIDSLDNSDGCFASNGYFAEFFDISKGRCSQIIKSLETKKVLKIKYHYEGKQIIKRVLNILKGGIKFSKGGYLENAEDNNTKVNNTKVNKKEKEKKEKALSKNTIEINSLKTENLPTYQQASLPEKKVAKKKRSAWTQLDMTMANFQFPEDWSKSLQETIILYFRYMEEKKGYNWGGITTIKAQMRHFKTLTNKYNDIEIINALNDTIFKGNVTVNPQWLINRKQKEQDEQQKQSTNNGKSIYENFAEMLNGNGNIQETDKHNIGWSN
tara:strand:- start:143 stop:1036 length:894 start_codon:yes stop_codon:yes gene_type:complete